MNEKGNKIIDLGEVRTQRGINIAVENFRRHLPELLENRQKVFAKVGERSLSLDEVSDILDGENNSNISGGGSNILYLKPPQTEAEREAEDHRVTMEYIDSPVFRLINGLPPEEVTKE